MALVLRCLDHRFGLRSPMGSIAGSADDDQSRHCGGWVAPVTGGFWGFFCKNGAKSAVMWGEIW